MAIRCVFLALRNAFAALAKTENPMWTPSTHEVTKPITIGITVVIIRQLTRNTTTTAFEMWNVCSVYLTVAP